MQIVLLLGSVALLTYAKNVAKPPKHSDYDYYGEMNATDYRTIYNSTNEFDKGQLQNNSDYNYTNYYYDEEEMQNYSDYNYTDYNYANYLYDYDDHDRNTYDYSNYYDYNHYNSEPEVKKPDGISEEFWERYQKTSKPMKELLIFHEAMRPKDGKLSMEALGITLLLAQMKIQTVSTGKEALKVYHKSLKTLPWKYRKRFYGIVNDTITLMQTSITQKRIKAQAKQLIKDYESGDIFLSKDKLYNGLEVPNMSQAEEMEAQVYNPIGQISMKLLTELVNPNTQNSYSRNQTPYLEEFAALWEKEHRNTTDTEKPPRSTTAKPKKEKEGKGKGKTTTAIPIK